MIVKLNSTSTSHKSSKEFIMADANNENDKEPSEWDKGSAQFTRYPPQNLPNFDEQALPPLRSSLTGRFFPIANDTANTLTPARMLPTEVSSV
jgi:hypothetical protein